MGWAIAELGHERLSQAAPHVGEPTALHHVKIIVMTY
jgi:hypothetical protein